MNAAALMHKAASAAALCEKLPRERVVECPFETKGYTKRLANVTETFRSQELRLRICPPVTDEEMANEVELHEKMVKELAELQGLVKK